MSEEYRVKVSVSNNLLIQAIENAGYKNQSEFARAMGLKPSMLNMLCGLRMSPMLRTGEFSPFALELMECLGACPTDLWTEEQLTMNLKKSSSWSVMGKEELHVLMNGEKKSLLEGVLSQELKQTMDEVRKSLTYKEQQLIGMRFDDNKTLEECAKEFKITRERVRQVEAKALRKMRQRSEKLRDFAEEM